MSWVWVTGSCVSTMVMLTLWRLWTLTPRLVQTSITPHSCDQSRSSTLPVYSSLNTTSSVDRSQPGRCMLNSDRVSVNFLNCWQMKSLTAASTALCAASFPLSAVRVTSHKSSLCCREYRPVVNWFTYPVLWFKCWWFTYSPSVVFISHTYINNQQLIHIIYVCNGMYSI